MTHLTVMPGPFVCILLLGGSSFISHNKNLLFDNMVIQIKKNEHHFFCLHTNTKGL